MNYEPKKYADLLGLAGFSDPLLKNHFTLYEGYVTNVNKLLEASQALVTEGKTATPEFAELRRRFGWEFNGMRLHEYYFDNLTKSKGASLTDSPLAKKLSADFGSFEDWEKEFRAVATMRGIGWAILAHDRVHDRLFNVWVNEHDTGHLAGATPLLILDVFEHAFMLDYGLKRVDYLDSFFPAVDWAVVGGRYAQAS